MQLTGSCHLQPRFATALGLFVLLAAHTLAAQATDTDTLTPWDVARLRSVTEVQVAPDGSRIAYVLAVPRDLSSEDNGPTWSELHVVDLAGQSRPYITGAVNVSHIRWRPDGQAISLLMKREGADSDKNMSLYAIPVDGGEARRLVALESSITEYDWRPDGKQLAVLAQEPEDADKKKAREKGFNAEIYEEDLRPVKVWLADADPQTDDKPTALNLPGSASEPHWSPDGQQLVVALAEKPLVDYTYMYRRLRIVDVRSGQVTTHIENPGKLGQVAWSPDGSKLAFLSGEDINDPSEGRLMIASATDGTFQELMKDYLPNISSIAWRDNSTIDFTADDSCLTSYGQVSIDDAQRVAIKSGGEIIGQLSRTISGADVAAVLGHSRLHPNEVFIRRDQQFVRLTNSNPWLDAKRLALQEVVRYTARDGEVVEGVLVRPLDEQQGQRYPLILAVHGGPESHVPNGWVTSYSNPGQVAAARGFAVFYPNYRGSTGRGVAFAKAHQADAAGKEFDDLIDGVDYLVTLGLVDTAKVGVTGGSYGGYATAWCCTHYSDRFAAGVMFVGISNNISKSGTTDIPDEMYLVHHRKRVWEDWDYFLQRSPLYYVEQAHTPLLIMHGKDDPRVHPSQSLELYRNLKILGKAPVRMVWYPGEGHGNRKAAARLDYNLRMLRWMEHYLKGSGGAPPPTAIDHGIKQEDKDKKEEDKP